MPQGKFIAKQKARAVPGSGKSSIVQGAEDYGRRIIGGAENLGRGLTRGIGGMIDSMPSVADYDSINAGAAGLRKVARRMGNLNR